jgi:7-cyano-7-deazaguanine reductase
MSNEIENIASVHLGKAGDGTVVKPYVTPDYIDPTLLVGIPRYLNRDQYDLYADDLPFLGYDVWNCYEFSTLTNNGFPVSGVLRIVYPCDSFKIVESKSLKLYLNSFNMYHSGITVDDVIMFVEDQIIKDLTKVLGEGVQVTFHDNNSRKLKPFGVVKFDTLEEYLSDDLSTMSFEHSKEDPAILQTKDTDYPDQFFFWHSSVLRSNCRVTNQPDWGDVYIVINSTKTVTPESLLQYIVSMRKENHFHEEITECIYKRLWDLLEPKELLVACLYTRRGGIDINPVRASHQGTVDKFAHYLYDDTILNNKTLRQ